MCHLCACGAWPAHASGRVKKEVTLQKYYVAQVEVCQKRGWHTNMNVRLRTRRDESKHTSNRSLKSLAAIFFILEELEQKHQMVSRPKVGTWQ